MNYNPDPSGYLLVSDPTDVEISFLQDRSSAVAFDYKEMLHTVTLEVNLVVTNKATATQETKTFLIPNVKKDEKVPLHDLTSLLEQQQPGFSDQYRIISIDGKDYFDVDEKNPLYNASTNTYRVAVMGEKIQKEDFNASKNSSSGSSSGSGIVLPTTIPIDNNNTQTPKEHNPQNTKDTSTLLPLEQLHFTNAYIHGYGDDTIRTEQNLTRAEMAMILYTVYGSPQVTTKEALYTDVSNNAWYGNAVTFVAENQLMIGYPDHLFHPNDDISRAEMATILASKSSHAVEQTILPFTDIRHHWANQYILHAYQKGMIVGYGDNTYQPDQKLTRGEAIVILNKAMNRPIHYDEMFEPKDLFENNWYYNSVMNATNKAVE